MCGGPPGSHRKITDVSGVCWFAAFAAVRANSGTPIANSPFTLISNPGGGDANAYAVQVLAAAIHGDFDQPTALHWCAFIMTFKAVGASPLMIPRNMQGPRVRFMMPRPMTVPDFIPTISFDPALMAAMDRPWRDIAFDQPEVVSSGMTPDDLVIP